MIASLLTAVACSSSHSARKTPEPVKISHFQATPELIPRGMTGKLCYGVQNASRLELNPPVEQLLPSDARCFDISPRQETTYTLTAYGTDGSKDTKTVQVRLEAPAPRLSNIAANKTRIRPGEQVRICFKVENASSIKAKPGKLDRRLNCITDRPHKTTIYRITALGGNHEEDTGTVTVRVR